MPSPTRWQKIVVVGLPSLIGAVFLVAFFTHGAAHWAASGVYGLLSAALVWWLRRQVRRNDSGAGRGRSAV
ncbi:hypothetical protein [Actinocrinis sp.]|uniref:hypothetical protein n=1 Tax=Actinocrinis sp. TaxID=1920516 RepID=UPI002D5C1D1F|nr:hypothetical protein [Actinocrinis sp.]HZP54357.1 hypothetical protein [Actinocrinis sp.]